MTGICIGEGGFIGLHDDSLNGSVSPVADAVIYYELATPIEYDLVEPLIYTIYQVSKYGTEQAIFPTHEDGSPSAPFRADISYSEAHIKYNEVEGITDVYQELSDEIATLRNLMGDVESLLTAL